MSKIIPIILSGGTGSRLWPVSRKKYPKPFMKVAGKPLLAHAFEYSSLVSNEALIVTNHDSYFLSENLIKESKSAIKVSYLLEPISRNTGPAIALAVRHVLKEHGENALCLVLAADHLISNKEAFKKAINQAKYEAESGNLVVFGIRPTAPETGYGYLEVADEGSRPQLLKNFIEKPNRLDAEKFLTAGRYYWNAGMFCFTAGVMAKNLKNYANDIWQISEDVYEKRKIESNFVEFDEINFASQPDISIDYAVMEKAKKISMVPAGFGWSDVGSWDAVANTQQSDNNGNSTSVTNNVVNFTDCNNTHVETTSHTKKVVELIGINNIAVVDTPDALLVIDRSNSQAVKCIVDKLKVGTNSHVTNLPSTVHRPWGTYATLKQEDGYQVKRITVLPGQKLSLQYHHKRSEHWVVTQGKAIVQVGDDMFETRPGEYRYIPLGEKHRLTNIGNDELVLIEVQIGSYLEEDDIVRLDDVYGRE
jgi:mannose-1-phosphate guanylyltransferase